jgi:hypothetical protein
MWAGVQELVREADRAKEPLAVAHHAAYRAKADYLYAIRRLHDAGGSLRELAEALRRATNGSTRSSTRPPSRPGAGGGTTTAVGPLEPCSFCGRPRDVCAKLIVGPRVFIP